MENVLDSYHALNEGVQAPADMPVAGAEKERSWGEAFDDVAGSTLATLANGGKPLHALAAGLNAGLNTEVFQEQKNNRARAAKLADLQLQQQEQRLIDMTQKNEQFAALSPGVIREQKQRLESQGLAIANQKELQKALWIKNAKIRENDLLQKELERLGYGALNFTGQTILDNSQAMKGIVESMILMEAYQESDEKGDMLLAQTGNWRRVTDENGKSRFVSLDGKLSFDASPEGVRNTIIAMRKQLKDDIAAAYAKGADATSLEQFSVKNILNQPNIEKVFGTYGNAAGIYSAFLNQTIVKNGKAYPAFTKEQKLGHVLSRSLQGAIVDGKISEEEKRFLAPLFAVSVKKMGGEVIWGDDVATSKIKLGDGSEVNLMKFATDLAERDTIMAAWKTKVAAIQAQESKNAQNSSSGEESSALPESAWFGLARAYGDEFKELPDEEQNNFVNIVNNTKSREDKALKLEKAKTIKDLSLDELRRLDRGWQEDVKKKKLDYKKFYSPYQNEIFLRERDDLYAQKAPKIAELRELEKKSSDYQEHIHGRRGLNPNQRRINVLRKHIDDINDKIKMRERKLSARGISFKEYK